LISHVDDANDARAIRKRLFAMGYEVFFQVIGEHDNLRDVVKGYAGQVSAAIVYYGNVAEFWVQNVLMELDLLPKLGGRRHLKLRWVFIGGLPSDRKSDFLSHYADLVVDATNCSVDDALRQFTTALAT